MQHAQSDLSSKLDAPADLISATYSNNVSLQNKSFADGFTKD
jgi:hypothetical protein